MAREYEEYPQSFRLFSMDDYIELVIDFVEHLRPDIALDRFISQSPKELLIAPNWGIKNYEFTALLQKKMREKLAYQGKFCSK
jgi:radical SAM superfamily enzyme